MIRYYWWKFQDWRARRRLEKLRAKLRNTPYRKDYK